MTRFITLLFTLLLVTAGVAPAAAATSEAASPTTTPSTDVTSLAGSGSTERATASQANPDTVGCVDGICHDDELGFDEPANLTDEQLDALVDRSMARVEELRGENFDESVPVEIRSRDEFRQSRFGSNTTTNDSFEQWNDGVWKALFVIGDDRRSGEVIDDTIGEAVGGFYRPSDGQIVIITATPESPTVNERTLVHELVHAMQDQNHDLTAPQYRGETQDADLAVDGVVEGEAGYIEALYEGRCESGEWTCFDDPLAGGGGNSGEIINRGVLYLLLQPYSDGPAYIHEVKANEGWAGVDDRVVAPPTTTTAIIDRRSVEPTDLNVPDESTDGWQRYPNQGVDGAEVTGEASIYMMFWYQATIYGADTIDPASIRATTDEYDRFNYVSAPSDGWVADELYPYQRGDDGGYVWTLEWETPEDADEFRRAYSGILSAHDANRTESGAYVVSDGPFSGAYGVDANGTRITIVHAPTEAGLFELRPTLEPDTTDSGPDISRDGVAGFGVAVFGVAATVAGLLAVAVMSRRLQ